MFRKLSDTERFFLCQNADWQSVVQAEDEEQAATIAMELLMHESIKKDLLREEDEDQVKASDNVAAVFAVKKITNNLFLNSEEIEAKFYYTPMIMADAGFHSEAKRLDLIFKEMSEKENFYTEDENE